MSRARPKPGNRFARLSVEPTESDESTTSHVAGTRAHRPHTRNASAHDNASLPPLTRAESGLREAISIIDSIQQKPEWWALASTRLLDALRPVLETVTSMSQSHAGLLDSRDPQSSMSIPVQDVLPGPNSPDVSLQTSFCPQSISVQDVESAVARVLPALLKSGLDRGLQGIRDTLQAGLNADDACRTRAASCCSATHQTEPPRPPPPPPNERDVYVSLANVPSTDAAHALLEMEVKVLVDSKMTRTTSTGAPSPMVHGVRKLANGTLRIRTASEDVRDALLNSPTEWLPALGPGAQVARERYAVEVRAVPTTFCPDEACAIQGVYQANAGVLPAATSIISMRWLRELPPDKSTSSLIVELDSVKTLSTVVYHGFSIRGRMCDVVPYVPAPTQCYFCQGWGHTVNTCPRKKSDQPIICARCAGPHATGACSCPHRPRCSSLQGCAHIVIKCANCGGRHKSFSVHCPMRRRAAAEVASQPKYARLLAAYSSSPPHMGRASASDLHRSLSFSGSPRAGSAWRD